MADSAFIIIPPLAALVFKAAGRHPMAGLIGGFAATGAGYSTSIVPTSLDALFAGITTSVMETLPGVEYQAVNPVSNYYFNIVASIVLAIIAGFIIDKLIEPNMVRKGVPRDYVDATKQGLDKKYQAKTVAYSENSVTAEEIEAAQKEMSPKLEPAEKKGLLWAAAGGTRAHRGHPRRRAHPGFTVAERGRRVPAEVAAAVLDRLHRLRILHAHGRRLRPGRGHRAVDERHRADDGRIDHRHDVLPHPRLHPRPVHRPVQLDGHRFVDRRRRRLRARGDRADRVRRDHRLHALLASVLNLFIVSGSSMWTLMAAVFVPLFALLGYEPAFIQAAFRVGDSATQVITPLNPYMIVLLGLVRRYEPTAGLGTVISRMFPFVIPFWLAWAALLALWYFLDLPLGPGNGIFLGQS